MGIEGGSNNNEVQSQAAHNVRTKVSGLLNPEFLQVYTESTGYLDTCLLTYKKYSQFRFVNSSNTAPPFHFRIN